MLSEAAIFGEFLVNERKPVESPLICYDINTCEWEEIGKITGVGKLYVCPQGFCIAETDPDNYGNDYTNLYDPKTGETSRYCKGAPLGISPSGRILAVDQFMGEGENENDLFCYSDVYDKNLLVKDFIDRSNYENCSIIQDMESLSETAFIIYADAEADSQYDVGWRMGYRRTGWHICAIPFDTEHLDDKGLAKEIISIR